MITNRLNRRSLLKYLASIPVTAGLGLHTPASAELVTTDDATAKSVGYTPVSPHDNQSCSSCGLYRGGSAPTGICPIFGGKEVSAKGWCTFWVIRG